MNETNEMSQKTEMTNGMLERNEAVNEECVPLKKKYIFHTHRGNI